MLPGRRLAHVEHLKQRRYVGKELWRYFVEPYETEVQARHGNQQQGFTEDSIGEHLIYAMFDWLTNRNLNREHG